MMRDRLIELLMNVPKLPITIGGRANGKTYQTAGNLADHLLSNGVVIIQCNIGDTVYQTDGVRIYELTILDVSLHKNKPYYETDEIDFDDDAIGKSIFLRREEAEEKIERRY